MHVDDIKTDPEFEALFADTRLTGADLEHLRNKLLTEGFHDPLVLWRGVLLDGYTRLAICREEGIEPAVRSVELADREAAVEWIRIHQHSRRNLDEKTRAKNIAAIYEIRKKRHGASDRFNHLGEKVNKTRHTVAEDLGVSPAKVQRSVEYVRGLESIERTEGSEARQEADRTKSMNEISRYGKQLPKKVIEGAMRGALAAMEPPHKEVVRKLLDMAKSLDASEKISLARELFRIARKWGLQRR